MSATLAAALVTLTLTALLVLLRRRRDADNETICIIQKWRDGK